MISFSKIEQEAIVLKAVWEMIDGMVNYEMFVKNTRTENTNLMFNTHSHMRLFNILLGDFLSLPQVRGNERLPFDLPKPSTSARDSDQTFLYYIRLACDSPQLCRDSAVLRDPLNSFADWLDAECCVEKVWLPSVNIELDVRIPRIYYIKICADLAKHNFARLSVNVRRIRKLLADHGHEINEGAAYTVLPEFYDWFHSHVFCYHSSVIAELLNNLRWAIFWYVLPEFERSFERVEPEPMYRFNYPAEVTDPLAQSMYWDLMNLARSNPWFPKFSVSTSFKDAF